MIRHPKRRGEWVEMQFMARAAAHGLTVSKPWGDSARYDFIVETRGLCHRVQVKSTSCKDRKAYLCNTVSRNITGLVGTYSAASIDFFAFYIVPEDLWYIVPIAELKRAKFAVYLNPYDRKNRYFRYMEAWHLLKLRRSRGVRAARRNPEGTRGTSPSQGGSRRSVPADPHAALDPVVSLLESRTAANPLPAI